MADDPALSYNYDADPRWLEHLEKLSLSSTEASNDAALLTLAKQSWYQHNVDPKYEPNNMTIDLVEQKTISERAHTWKTATFGKPTFCEVCSQLLWGVRRQGLKCRSCRAITHHKCQAEADQSIACKFDAPAPVYVGTHEFLEQQFNAPAYCNVCRKLLRGLVRQGRACTKCGVIVHDGCKEKLLFACKTTHMEFLPESELKSPCRLIEGNVGKSLDTSCIECGKDASSVKALTGYQCIWCRKCVHTYCRKPEHAARPCDYGYFGSLILQPSWAGHQPETRCADDEASGACITDLVVEVPESASPLIVLINKRSGGQVGARIIQRLCRYLNPLQIFDLAKGGPAPAIRAFKNVKNFRVLACGGDGTVGWVLGAIDAIKPVCTPPVCVLPLGTGNDLARTLGWGGGFSDQSIKGILTDVMNADTVTMDRWSLLRKVGGGIHKETAALKDEDGYESISVMNNYFSVGIDAKIALTFHNAREANPKKFTSRSSNKLFYAKAGVKELFSECLDLKPLITLVCDGEEVPLPDIQALVVTNLPSYSGGINLWNIKRTAGGQDFQSLTVDDSLHSLKDYSSEFLPQNYEMIKEEDDDPDPEPSAAVSEAPTIVPAAADVSDKQPDAKGDVDNDKDADAVSADIKPDLDKENDWRPQSIRDGLLEVVGLRSSLQVGMIYVNVSSAVRICQGSEIVIRMKEGIELPVQVDGEPWLQSSCEFKLRIHKQAPMMASKSCKWT